MIIISIDVGIRNLAICKLDADENHVLEWDVSGVPPESDRGIFPSMNQHLNERKWVLEDVDLVLIERQPGKNRKMKSVENFLHAYFVVHNKEVLIYDARYKVPDVVGAGKAMYRKRKQTAIVRCREYIEKTMDKNSRWLDVFDKSKKKDDLADTVLQALSYVQRKDDVKTTLSKKSKKISARKPTANQKTTKYSKSNLAWFYKNEGKEAFEKSKRLQKDVARYYRNVDELIEELEAV